MTELFMRIDTQERYELPEAVKQDLSAIFPAGSYEAILDRIYLFTAKDADDDPYSGFYDSAQDRLYLNSELLERSSEYLALIVAHETMHYYQRKVLGRHFSVFGEKDYIPEVGKNPYGNEEEAVIVMLCVRALKHPDYPVFSVSLAGAQTASASREELESCYVPYLEGLGLRLSLF